MSEFCNKWGLKVNLSKTKIMVFRNGGYLKKCEKCFFQGHTVDTASFYKYLGLLFTTKLSWTKAKKTLVTQAQKALVMLKQVHSKLGGLAVKPAFKMFDQMVVPIITYGAEIWGYEYSKDIERVQIKYCKYLLGLPVFSHNSAVLGECGRLPLCVVYMKKCIKFWLKLLHMPEERYPRASYNMLKEIGRAHV